MEAENTKPLLQPIQLGDLQLKNRVVMASLSRNRADYETKIQSEHAPKYYAERSRTAGLVMTECTIISMSGYSARGYSCINTEPQVEAWKKVADAVHKEGGVIFMELAHCGRAGLREILGDKPMGPSPIRNRHKGRGLNGPQDFEEPEEMTIEQIKQIIEEFRVAAENAKRAGFDGIELHGCSGFLIDQFIRDATNQRRDEYGGSVENRCRFALEVIDAVSSVFGSNRVGIKVAPLGRVNDMFDSNPIETYSYLLTELSKRNIAFVEMLRNPEFISPPNLYGIAPEEQCDDLFATLKPYFNGVFIGNMSIRFEEGNELVKEGKVDMVSMGRPFISNPDLVERFRNGWELTEADVKTFYTPGPEGYIDYKDYEKKNS